MYQHRGSISEATHAILRQWSKKQADSISAYTNLATALRNSWMAYLISEELENKALETPKRMYKRLIWVVTVCTCGKVIFLSYPCMQMCLCACVSVRAISCSWCFEKLAKGSTRPE